MNIVGVTACTSGVAHTYMAAELLGKIACKAVYDIAVETQGALGNENILSDVVIAKSDVALIIADVNIEGMERFDHCRVIQTNISTFLKDPNAILRAAEKLKTAPANTVINI